MSDHLPHLLVLISYQINGQQKPTKYIIKDKQDEASLLSFYNEIDISPRNTNLPNELITDPNVT